ncbi:unnamed protein product [Cylicocyclus nassatus]|uniref:Phospholipase A2 n=1 Tax=Cylicocyclus nassatus TaxID=53992 RepID=A0AA36GJU9_CYLNA|nr:unnamed protein product [Cylicocyclus nassatus]
MYIVLILLSLVYAVVPQDHAPMHLGLHNFNSVTDCVLGHWGLRYNNYGCWCGKGGSGTPIDKIDECCRAHDWCYDAAMKRGCFKSEVYFDGYQWSCQKFGNEKHAICSGE